MMGLTNCYKMALFYIYICAFLLEATAVIPMLQTNSRYVGIILVVSILALLSSSACDSASAYKLYLN